MARPRISPSARSVPISFSVKPHLAEKIEEYSHQLRFSRSKFLAQAVIESINKIELGAHLDDLDYRNFSDDRIAMICKVRLDEATEINPTVLKQLKDSIKDLERRQRQAKRDEAFATTMTKEPADPDSIEVEVFKLKGSRYSIVDLTNEQPLGEITKLDYKVKPWAVMDLTDQELGRFRLLRQAKDYAINHNWG